METHERREEPEKQITVVLLINGQESRIALNVGRVGQTSHSTQHFGLTGEVSLDQRCKEQPLAVDAGLEWDEGRDQSGHHMTNVHFTAANVHFWPILSKLVWDVRKCPEVT